jgi:NIPSNAP
MKRQTPLTSHPDSDFVRVQTCCPIVELRQYTLHPGSRDTLIELFDREFVGSQEAVGMKVIGQFRDLDDPNRFVWLKGFHDMPSRAQALKEFYAGPVWKAHREVANATMIDSDGLVVATSYYFDAPAGDHFVDFFDLVVKPVLIGAGASILAYFVTESSANSFPALPVREGENVFVWFSRFRDQVEHERHDAALARSPLWSGEISQELARRVKRDPEVLRLSPTARSQLHD